MACKQPTTRRAVIDFAVQRKRKFYFCSFCVRRHHPMFVKQRSYQRNLYVYSQNKNKIKIADRLKRIFSTCVEHSHIKLPLSLLLFFSLHFLVVVSKSSDCLQFKHAFAMCHSNSNKITNKKNKNEKKP